jgi:4,5-DOPA dioxygenase extradiol
MSARMPAAFIGHGSPMNALEHNRYTDAWRAFGASVPKPRAVLVVSAHWYINATAVTAMETPRTIHDFFGFPDELFAVEYPAPGAPWLAEAVAAVAEPHWVGADADSWGIDHGTWSVLCHMFPNADVPVAQLAINASLPFEDHVDIGARLAPLRDEGVLILGSGNVVHNLRMIDWSRPDAAFDWAKRFDEAGRKVMTSNPGDVLRLRGEPEFAQAVPTPDHFIPLLYLAGVARAAGHGADILVDGYSMGSLSMTAYVVEGPAPASSTDDAPAATVPHDVPPEDTNT